MCFKLASDSPVLQACHSHMLEAIDDCTTGLLQSSDQINGLQLKHQVEFKALSTTHV